MSFRQTTVCLLVIGLLFYPFAWLPRAEALVVCPPGWIPNTSPTATESCRNPEDSNLGMGLAIIFTGGLAALASLGDSDLEACLHLCHYTDPAQQLECYEGCRIAFSHDL